MNIEEYREYCLQKAGVSEGFPFDESTLVFKVCGKIFALLDVDSFEFVNLKCEPQLALEMREQYEAIRPGFHMNKKHWNSVYLDGSLSDALIYQLTDHSYEQVVRKLPKASREQLKLQD